ncbi:resistin-like beta [Ctenodactylus gundi]
MKATYCLLILISLLQLMTPGNTQHSLDSLVDDKIKEALKRLGMAVTGCACGYACGSWGVQKGTTCHCQCGVVDWTTARCCHLA